MDNKNFVLSYVLDCTTGKLSFADCGPFWQLGVMAILLAIAVLFLVALITRPGSQPNQS